MGTPLGTKIQGLERTVIENLKETGLVEHPRFYHRDLKDPDEPVTLAYKVAEIYTQELDSFDPLIYLLPLEEEIRNVAGVMTIQSQYDEQTGVHTLRIMLDKSSILDALQFKYELLLKINQRVEKYVRDLGQKPAEREVSFRHELAKVRKAFGDFPNRKKGKQPA